MPSRVYQKTSFELTSYMGLLIDCLLKKYKPDESHLIFADLCS